MGIQVVANSSFLGTSGYAEHSRSFFTNLNKLIPVRVRNYAHDPDLTKYSKETMNMIIESNWADPPYKIGSPFTLNPNDTLVNIVLNESHHYYFYDNYPSPKIAYNVWEATRQIPEFFNKILEYDNFWVPSEWQRNCTIEQGYPEDKIKVVSEGVDINLFKPAIDLKKERQTLYKRFGIPENTFTFFIAGRWDYRKSVTEMVSAFNDVFKNTDNVMLVISVDNPFSVDGMKSTEERLKHHKLESDKIKVVHYPSTFTRQDYIEFIKISNIYLSCSRSEGWNLPLSEAIACGTPSICSNWGAQLEFADGISHTVNISEFKKPQQVFMLGDNQDIGFWAEPDFNHLRTVMKNVYDNYNESKTKALKLSKYMRDIYNWPNVANIGAKYINELVESSKKISIPVINKEFRENEIKLNLGCGNDIKKDYINIDKYNNTGRVDLKADIGVLPFDDGTVDEIFTSHVFEHISINDMYAVINEWRRVLRDDGRLILHLPNLEHEINIWLQATDDKKWLEVHRIFGSQSHPGNTHFCGFNQGSLKSFLETFNFYVEKCEMGNRGMGDEIQCVAYKLKEPVINSTNYICHFVDGPFIDITGDPNDKGYYQIDFLDPDNEAAVHQTTLSINCWTRPFRKYFTNWLVKVRRNGVLKFEHKFDLKGKNVLIGFDTKSIGDTIAWIPAVEEFRKKYNCNVVVSTFWNKLFEGHDSYKNLSFVPPGSKVENLYASYSIGCYTGDFNKNLYDWRTVPLGKVASDILGVEYKEIITDLVFTPLSNPMKEKYVTLSEHSTFSCKYWQRENGWQDVVDYLNSIGYKVVVVSKEPTNLKNIINRTNRSIEDTINTIYYSEAILTVSTGPAWIAWALRKPVIMISGFSEPFSEFTTNCERIINREVCNSCFNDVNNGFTTNSDVWVCPRHVGTERQFECTKKITPEMVIESINKILNKKGVE